MVEDSRTELAAQVLEQAGAPSHAHEHYQSVINRLARIEGHVRAVKRMVEAGTPCPEVLVQIAAVRSALNSVGRVILEDHLKSCMVDAVKSGDFEDAYRDLEQSLHHFIR
jgi:DNA-binding FrmR family transcriptional regulator